MLAIIVVNFLSGGLGYVLSNDRPDGDQHYYLELALNLRERGRFVQSGINPFRPQDGLEPPHATRAPLYPALLVPLASRTSAFFWQAKLLTLLLCVLLFPSLFFACRGSWGDKSCLLALLFLSLNGSFVLRAAEIAVDGLMVLLVFIGLWATEHALRSGRGYWLVGWCYVVGYLAKGTMALLVPGFIIGVLLTRIPLRRKVTNLACAGAVTVLVLLPWMYRNHRCFGRPLYFDSKSSFWMDTWDKADEGYYIPHPPDSLPSARTYFASHTSLDAARRVASGMVSIVRRLDESVGLKSPPVLRLDNLSGIGLLLLGLWGMWRDPEHPRRVFMLSSIALFVLFHAWYAPIATPTRFIAVLAPYVLLYAASVLVPLMQRLQDRRWIRPAALGTALVLIALMQSQAWSDASWHVWGGRMSTSDELFLHQLAGMTEERDAVVTQPGHGFPWLYIINRRDQWMPAYSDLSRTTTFFRQWGIGFVVVSPQLRELRAYVLAPYIRYQQGQGLVALKDPRGWRLVLGDRERPSPYLLYQISLPSNRISAKTSHSSTQFLSRAIRSVSAQRRERSRTGSLAAQVCWVEAGTI